MTFHPDFRAAFRKTLLPVLLASACLGLVGASNLPGPAAAGSPAWNEDVSLREEVRLAGGSLPEPATPGRLEAAPSQAGESAAGLDRFAAKVAHAAHAAQAGAEPESGAYARARDWIEEILQGPLTAGILFTSLCLAFFIGALHALQPGHGKTLVAAYLVGSRGTVWHAILLGMIVTFTHTFSVMMLGVVVLYLSHRVLPETVNFWLGILSGIIVAVMGAWMLVTSYRRWILHKHGIKDIASHGHTHLFGGHHHHHGHDHGHGHDHAHDHSRSLDHGHHHDHDHDHGHDHGHEHALLHEPGQSHAHTHAPARPRVRLPSASLAPSAPSAGGSGEEVSLWRLFSLGLVGGIVPCLDAILLLLIAVALNRVAFGLVIILVFSLGIATVLVAVGVMMVKAKEAVNRFRGGTAFLARMPVVSAALITLIGLAMLFQTFATAGTAPMGR